ncbi:MAG: response regulator [Syntrophomonas sp.]|uniref:response regulator n=1 Tax=Syntrophomonas sp. TaxID=2053627 RepID=UPI002625692E|nr:response regulator [Syntrophomonas sp.]MDD2510300.1 response regulator [Syntrophomonas sp.]MDD3878548.1 response regulator [Syntrophomonas sp.]MDD4626331.1 response regulator [Syntrophomonas sp.]
MKGIRTDGTPIKVMAVDDSPISRKMIKKALEPEGFLIVGEAGNGKEAVERYPQFQPDIITMDVTMPIMDGLDAASMIKGINPKQKIIMLSAMGDDDIINDAKSRGINDVCCKPFKAEELVEKILKAIEN